MVVFTCGHCGESLQKPKVEKHYMTKCRNRNPNLSCMDCFKDFLGNDYEAHIKCITEEERYSGKGFTPKEKKGEKKQTAWVEMLQSVLDEQKDAPKKVLRIIETISKHNNTPRKKPKFINFVKNVCGHKTNPKDMDQAWDLISVKLTALSNATNQNKNQNQNGTAAKKDVVEEDEDNETNSKDKNQEESPDSADNDGNESQNGEAEANGEADVDDKKLTKKQRKEEKKRKKYEAELQSAETPVIEPEEEETENKKGKKKKNRTNSKSQDTEENGKDKEKKRKRQDTVNGNTEVVENGTQNVEEVVNKDKTQKKKPKMDDKEDAEESICLHDQNVAKIGELAVSGDKFNWHAVILSVLEKKGNELPFKRLQKKVLSEYMELTGQDVDDRIADKFIKKLKSAPNVRVDKNRVVLVQ